MNKLILILSLILFGAGSALAGVGCDATNLKSFYIEAERPTDPQFSNVLLINLDTPCAGKNSVYLENSAGAYDGILSLTLMAFATGKKLVFVVDEKTTIGGDAASRILFVYPAP